MLWLRMVRVVFSPLAGPIEKEENQMKRLRGFLRVRNLLLCAIVLGAGVALYVATVPSTEAIAGPSACTYYSSGTYKTAVGGRVVGCCGQISTWGVTTKWVRCERLNCLDVLCPN